jgi:hypothetical protein
MIGNNKVMQHSLGKDKEASYKENTFELSKVFIITYLINSIYSETAVLCFHKRSLVL